MQQEKVQLILIKDDYEVMMKYLRGSQGRHFFDHHNIEELQAELKKAKLVSQKEAPKDVVRLNSVITVREEKEGKIMQVILVTPNKADIKQKMISVFSPIGTALIGFRKGQKVEWTVPSGKKNFTIMDVINEVG